MPKAYVVAEIQVTDPEGYADYRALSTASLAQYGGTWLARGGQRTQFEGSDEQHNEQEDEDHIEEEKYKKTAITLLNLL